MIGKKIKDQKTGNVGAQKVLLPFGSLLQSMANKLPPEPKRERKHMLNYRRQRNIVTDEQVAEMREEYSKLKTGRIKWCDEKARELGVTGHHIMAICTFNARVRFDFPK